jgi:hypothetical protein
MPWTGSSCRGRPARACRGHLALGCFFFFLFFLFFSKKKDKQKKKHAAETAAARAGKMPATRPSGHFLSSRYHIVAYLAESVMVG